MKKTGNTYCFQDPPRVLAYASVVGKKEGEGPLSRDFDYISDDNTFGEQTWEKAESRMMSMALERALSKAHLPPSQLGCILGGDLLNQCIGTTFALRPTNVPFLGLYGACSTMAEGLLVASCLVESGFEQTACAITSSHFCSAERQYRYPLEYGGQRPQTAQWTATASGCCILGAQGDGPYITHVTCGRIVDKGITDANNMGAAMAPAAYDTLSAFFRDTGYKPADFDLILTGDLGELGHAIVRDFFQRDGVDMGPQFQDCGLLLYDRKHQDMHAGASGCGCSASVLNGYLLRKMREGKWKTILFAPTGALLSPTSSGQGESIPSICHAVRLSAVRE